MDEDFTPLYLDSRVWELYRIDCDNQGITPTIHDFVLWVQEEYA